MKNAADNYLKGTGSMEDIQTALRKGIEEGTTSRNIADRIQNVLTSFEGMKEGKERFEKLGVVTGQEGKLSSFDAYTKQQRESGQATVSGQVELMGDINITVDAPTNITDQQVFNIFNSPEVQTQIFKIVKTMTDTEIKKLQKN